MWLLWLFLCYTSCEILFMKKTITKAGNIYIQKTIRVGKKTTSKTIKKLGNIQTRMEEFNMTREQVLEWVDSQIRELEAQEALSSPTTSITVPIEKASLNSYPLVETGYLFLQKICYELKLDTICQKIVDQRQFHFDFLNIILTLIYNQILHPSSKDRCRQLSQSMIEPPTIHDQEIYRTLSVLAQNQEDFLQDLYWNTNQVIKRNTDILYYDCTNFYCEIEQPKGDLRKYGVSKENRPNPIIQFGLFMDADGIPFTMNVNPGNQNEVKSIDKTTIKKINRDFEVKNFIYCSDSGLATKTIRKAILGLFHQNDYIVTQSIKKMSQEKQQWALNTDEDEWWYYWSTDSKTGKKQKYRLHFSQINQNPENTTRYFKSRWFRNEEGFDERFIVTFSPKYKAYLQSLRTSQVERAKKKIKTKGKKRATDPERLIQENHLTQEGEMAEVVIKAIDYDQIEYEEKYDGFYCVATSLDGEEKKILDLCAKRYDIETCFREMKTYFNARPIYLQRDERIQAHFMICFMALLVFRILKKQLGDQFTSQEILDTLRNFKHYDLFGQGYGYAYSPNLVSESLVATSGLELDKTFIRQLEMKKIIAKSKSGKK